MKKMSWKHVASVISLVAGGAFMCQPLFRLFKTDFDEYRAKKAVIRWSADGTDFTGPVSFQDQHKRLRYQSFLSPDAKTQVFVGTDSLVIDRYEHAKQEWSAEHSCHPFRGDWTEMRPLHVNGFAPCRRCRYLVHAKGRSSRKELHPDGNTHFYREYDGFELISEAGWEFRTGEEMVLAPPSSSVPTSAPSSPPPPGPPISVY